MSARLPRFFGLLASSALIVTAGAGSASADAWKEQGGSCDKKTWAKPDDAEIGDLSKCTKLWAAYRTDFKAVKGDYKVNVVVGMKRLYAQGSESDAKLAKGELERLGVTELPRRKGETTTAGNGNGNAPAKEEAGRKTFKPAPADKKQIAAAEKHFKTGIAAYKKKDLDKAAAAYIKMTEVAPGYGKGHYNAACIYALKKDEKNMATYLMNLRDMAGGGDANAAELLKATRKDEDFKDFKDESAEYKRITGYAKVLVINHLGEKGEENVDNLLGSLDKLGYANESKDSDKKVDKKPVIYFAEHARVQAFIVKEVLNHPKTTAKQMDAEGLKGFDVVVQWNDDVKGEPKSYVKDPEEAEKELDNLERKQDELLSKPEDAVDELDEALGKPGEVTDKIEDTLDRPGDAVDKVEKTLDKVKSPFK